MILFQTDAQKESLRGIEEHLVRTLLPEPQSEPSSSAVPVRREYFFLLIILLLSLDPRAFWVTPCSITAILANN